MCEAHAFGVGSGSGCVGDGGQVVVLDALSDGLEGFYADFLQVGLTFRHDVADEAFAILVVFLLVEDDDAAHLGQLANDGAYLAQLCTADDDVAHLAVLHAEEQVVALLELDAEGHCHATGIEEREFADDPHVAAFGEQGNVVAFLHTHLLQCGTKGIDLACRVGVAEGFPFRTFLFEEERVGGKFAAAVLKSVDKGIFHEYS